MKNAGSPVTSIVPYCPIDTFFKRCVSNDDDDDDDNYLSRLICRSDKWMVMMTTTPMMTVM